MANTTWNPSDKGASITLSNGNLTATNTGVSAVRAIDKQITGKFYWEVTATTFANNSSAIGILSPTVSLVNPFTLVGSCGLQRVGVITVDGATVVSGFGTVANGTVVCVAFDASARLFWLRLGAAGLWNNSAAANPATGAGGVDSRLAQGVPAYPGWSGGVSGDACTANFGDSAFTGAVPVGFTSGFTSGVASPTNAIATQSALEQFLTTNPPAQITQVAIEHWVTTATVSGQAMVTQVALEQWARVVPDGAQARVMVMA